MNESLFTVKNVRDISMLDSFNVSMFTFPVLTQVTRARLVTHTTETERNTVARADAFPAIKTR